jgi:hypothetical protein
MFGMVNVMAGRAINDPVLKRFRDALDHIYGNRLERVVLFGSRGAVINALPFSAGAYQAQTGFMHELRRDGLDL